MHFYCMGYVFLIDLHSHSTSSDGQDTPQQLVQLAAKIGVQALALTDHDTLDGLAEAELAAEQAGIIFIRGIELEVEHQGRSFHLLGLNLNHHTTQFEQALVQLRRQREQRNLKMVDLMQRAGLNVHYADIQKLAGGAVIGRPHFAKYMVQAGIVKHYQQAFDRYLADHQPFYLKKQGLPLPDAIQLIHDCGGLALIAHPLALYMSWPRLSQFCQDVHSCGVDGLEAYHPSASSTQAQRLVDIAKHFGMKISGGSDYHGQNKHGRELGKVGKNRTIDINILEELIKS
jgi:predicted metal-dependent phosphoesterase TrpH